MARLELSEGHALSPPTPRRLPPPDLLFPRLRGRIRLRRSPHDRRREDDEGIHQDRSMPLTHATKEDRHEIKDDRALGHRFGWRAHRR